MTIKRTSKFLSLLLRHRPEVIGLNLDAHGWADVDELIAKANNNGNALTRTEIEEVVRTNPKQRFTLNEDHSKIRANQGHSITVDLGLQPEEPPAMLFHGTATRFVEAISAEGLIKGSRNHVHLSADLATASNVGTRHGTLAVAEVNAAAMSAEGYQFFVSANGVWLTDAVPPRFLSWRAG